MFYPDAIIDIMFTCFFILTFFESCRHSVSLLLSYFHMYLLKIRTVSCLTSVCSSNREKYTGMRQSSLGPALTSRHCSSWFFITEPTMTAEVFSLPPFSVLLDVSRAFSLPHQSSHLVFAVSFTDVAFLKSTCYLLTWLSLSFGSSAVSSWLGSSYTFCQESHRAQGWIIGTSYFVAHSFDLSSYRWA